MVAWDGSGGILQLVTELSGEHETALTRDFRELFHVSIHDVGGPVPYDEAAHLLKALRSDPSSWYHAAIGGWDYPITREGIVLMELWDLELRKGLSKKQRNKFKAFPRPWPAKKSKLGGNNKIRRSIADVKRILRPNS